MPPFLTASAAAQMRNSAFGFLSAALAAAASGGCGATLPGPGGAAGLAGYQAANFFSPAGYHVAGLPDGNVRVTATGAATMSKERVEKIALTRAAEYGAEQKRKAFLTGPAVHGVSCGKSFTSDRGNKVPIRPTDYRTVTIDVSYGDNVADPAYRPTRETAEALKAELASEVAAPDAQAALAADLARSCGR